jgi:hypothetical protein
MKCIPTTMVRIGSGWTLSHYAEWKIGYADEQGMMQIAPRFTCTEQFQEGVARVALNCDLIQDGEYTRMESNE